MLRLILSDRAALRRAAATPRRIERRADWTNLDAGEPGPGCALEILTCTKEDRPAGLVQGHGHAWIRLWRDFDHYVSIGFYPDESTGIDPEDMPGLRMPGMLLVPDKYDRIDWPRKSVRLPLTPARFRAVVAWIEGLQAGRDRGALAFDLVDRNCVGFTVRAARRCGVQVRADQPILGFLPLPVPDVLMAARRLVYRLGLALFGGRATLRRQWRGEKPNVQEITVTGIPPIFADLRAVLRQPVPFYHVRALQDWQDAQTRQAAAADPASLGTLEEQT